MQTSTDTNKYRSLIPNDFDLPRRINRLPELAYNLWWTWNPAAMRLFLLIDRYHWEICQHNPISFLRIVDRAAFNSMAQNRHFLERYDQVCASFDTYMSSKDTWFSKNYAELSQKCMAYFSMEFGLHETLPIYAGGLGVLSGDHLKEASDLGLPMVALGFLYTHGYFSQRITEDGWQEKRPYTMNLAESMITPLVDREGHPLTVEVELPGRIVFLRLWKVQVGRVPLFLLDSDLEENTLGDRKLTTNLYSGDPETRLQQEILLGLGGVRALHLLGYEPTVWHMNEGHAAFMALERIRLKIAAGKSPEAAQDEVQRTNIFTTHTPVPAGNDEFPRYLIEKYFSQYWPALGLDRESFQQLGNVAREWGEAFSMPVLAIKLSAFTNGVSELHARVTRRIWHFLWPNRPEDEVPITSVTNGIHTPTWLARRLRNLCDQYFLPDWLERLDDPEIWEDLAKIPDEELWAVRRHLKRKLVLYIQERARQMWVTGTVQPVQVIASGVLLDPYVLTLGFARRFAPYKRADLILRDSDRLLELLNRPNLPVQIIFAGKSHPDNEAGKLLIQKVYQAVKNSRNGGRLVFLEEYDLNLARYLVQGVDVWLNTPRRPQEASGTSGQKAAINGVLNFSVLDGWWREGYNGRNGWAIGEDVNPVDPDQQDQRDAQDFYQILEHEIIPMYYQERTAEGLPREWIARMRESIRTLAPQFGTTRMLKEYTERLYLPGLQIEAKMEV